jgi:hypothetical protein
MPSGRESTMLAVDPTGAPPTRQSSEPESTAGSKAPRAAQVEPKRKVPSVDATLVPVASATRASCG